MIKQNSVLTIDITDLGTNGEGVGRVDGFAIFVENALPGEKVEILVTRVKKSYGFGKLIKSIKQSEFREKPQCSLYKLCGGCQLQHLTYNEQLKYKAKKVKEALNRIGGFSQIDIEECTPCQDYFHYRNKSQFAVGYVNGIARIGYYKEGTHELVPVNECLIANPLNTKIITIIEKFMKEYNIQPYDEKSGEGIIRNLITRFSISSKSVMVCLVINSDNLPHSQILVDSLKAIEGMKSIVCNINKEKDSAVFSEKNQLLWGDSYIIDTISGIDFKISPTSFFQVNTIQTEKIYKTVMEFAQLENEDNVLDMYCGIGGITLFLAKKAKMVFGVELLEEAVENARDNGVLNKIENVKFFTGKAEEMIDPLLTEEEFNPNIIVVDPPRKGCEQSLLSSILLINPQKIIYISCDPATLARDAKILCAGGYEIKKVRPIDNFCQTSHVETVVLMCRVK